MMYEEDLNADQIALQGKFRFLTMIIAEINKLFTDEMIAASISHNDTSPKLSIYIHPLNTDSLKMTRIGESYITPETLIPQFFKLIGKSEWLKESI